MGSVELAGRVALVTGAASGIGRASARALAAAGAAVVVSDIDTAGGEETAAAIRDLGGEASFERADVSRADDVQRLVDATVARYGRLDCAHNNAGLDTAIASIADAEEAEWDRAIRVNLTSVWLCLRAEIRQMLAQGGGAIVNTASVGGLTAVPGNAGYAAAKHGVIGLTRTAAIEYATYGIRVNALCPGMTRTAMVERLTATAPAMMGAVTLPIGRLAEPEEMAGAVVFLCSDAASYLTGQAIPVDGGVTAS